MSNDQARAVGRQALSCSSPACAGLDATKFCHFPVLALMPPSSFTALVWLSRPVLADHYRYFLTKKKVSNVFVLKMFWGEKRMKKWMYQALTRRRDDMIFRCDLSCLMVPITGEGGSM